MNRPEEMGGWGPSNADVNGWLSDITCLASKKTDPGAIRATEDAGTAGGAGRTAPPNRLQGCAATRRSFV